MLTACGIETELNLFSTFHDFVATVLTACGIETFSYHINIINLKEVATVLTACGIETYEECMKPFMNIISCNSAYRLRY